MSIAFQHVPHPHIAQRKKTGAPHTTDESVGINGKVALGLTTVVGTMWCAYAFAVLALICAAVAISTGTVLALVSWLSQTFIQLVMLSVIMVGPEHPLPRVGQARRMTYQDADATFHESEQIQGSPARSRQGDQHAARQIAGLEAALIKAKGA